MWAIFYTPPKGGTLSLCTIDISSGLAAIVKQVFTVRNPCLFPPIRFPFIPLFWFVELFPDECLRSVNLC